MEQRKLSWFPSSLFLPPFICLFISFFSIPTGIRLTLTENGYLLKDLANIVCDYIQPAADFMQLMLQATAISMFNELKEPSTGANWTSTDGQLQVDISHILSNRSRFNNKCSISYGSFFHQLPWPWAVCLGAANSSPEEAKQQITRHNRLLGSLALPNVALHLIDQDTTPTTQSSPRDEPYCLVIANSWQSTPTHNLRLTLLENCLRQVLRDHANAPVEGLDITCLNYFVPLDHDLDVPPCDLDSSTWEAIMALVKLPTITHISLATNVAVHLGKLAITDQVSNDIDTKKSSTSSNLLPFSLSLEGEVLYGASSDFQEMNLEALTSTEYSTKITTRLKQFVKTLSSSKVLTALGIRNCSSTCIGMLVPFLDSVAPNLLSLELSTNHDIDPHPLCMSNVFTTLQRNPRLSFLKATINSPAEALGLSYQLESLHDLKAVSIHLFPNPLTVENFYPEWPDVGHRNIAENEEIVAGIERLWQYLATSRISSLEVSGSWALKPQDLVCLDDQNDYSLTTAPLLSSLVNSVRSSQSLRHLSMDFPTMSSLLTDHEVKLVTESIISLLKTYRLTSMRLRGFHLPLAFFEDVSSIFAAYTKVERWPMWKQSNTSNSSKPSQLKELLLEAFHLPKNTNKKERASALSNFLSCIPSALELLVLTSVDEIGSSFFQTSKALQASRTMTLVCASP
jgi:hypothetical protein